MNQPASRIEIVRHGYLAEVRLNRPDKYNGMDLAMMDGLLAAARSLKKADDIRAVILYGEGPAFCAGLDFPAVTRHPFRVLLGFLPWWRKDNLFQRVCLAWRDLPMPVIAVTHGHCIGAGLQLALACDFRFSAPDCEFSIMEIRWGLLPDMGGSVTLRGLVNDDVAMELAMSGRRVPAEEALALGLLTRIENEPLAAARDLAERLSEQSPSAISAIKRLFTKTARGSERRALRAERRLQLGLLLGANQREAMRANFEKRAPTFRRR
ncbi:MAG: crotonase/enoyl-CoA hydratase family protein [Wenzhouxiangella sp.]